MASSTNMDKLQDGSPTKAELQRMERRRRRRGERERERESESTSADIQGWVGQTDLYIETWER